MTRIIYAGQTVKARDWKGQDIILTAITPPIQGKDFEVVWVCRPDEWTAAQREAREPQGIPWPVEDVRRV